MYFWPPIVNFQPVIDAASVAYGLRPNLLGMPPFGANTMAPTRIYNPVEDDVMEVEVFEPNQQKTQRGTAMQPEPNPGPVYANPWSYPYLYGGFGYGPYGGYYGAPYWPTATPWGAYAWPYGGGYPYVYPSYPYWGGYGWGGGPRRRHHKRLPIRGGGRHPNPEGDQENPLAFWSTPYYWAGYGGYPYWGGYPSWGAYPAWGGYPYWGAYPYWGGYSPWWGGGFWGGGFKGKFGGGATISGGGGFGPGVTISGGGAGGGSGVTISNPYKHPNIRSLLAA